MGNLDLINLPPNMSHFPTITISNESPINPPITQRPTNNKFLSQPTLLTKIAERFSQIKQQQNEDFNNEIKTSLPLSNANLVPDPTMIPKDFTRHVLALIKENEMLVKMGMSPKNLVEEKLKLLRPSKRKFFMVQLLKLKSKEQISTSKLSGEYLELGVHNTEVEKILKDSTRPEILKRLNHQQRRVERRRRQSKRNNTLSLPEVQKPSLLNLLASKCTLDHVNDHESHDCN